MKMETYRMIAPLQFKPEEIESIHFFSQHWQGLIGDGALRFQFNNRNSFSKIWPEGEENDPWWRRFWVSQAEQRPASFHFQVHKGDFPLGAGRFQGLWQMLAARGPLQLRVLVFWPQPKNEEAEKELRPKLEQSFTQCLHFLDLSRKESSARLRAQQLYESEQMLESVLESQSDLLCRFNPDTTLSYVNLAYARFFGYDKSELIGRKFIDLVPQSYHQEILERLKFLSPHRPRQTMKHSALDSESRLRWLEWTDQAIFDAKGKVVEFQAVGRDLTELHFSEEQFRHLFEHMQAGVVYHGPKGGIIQCNKAAEKILGLSRDQMQGRTSLDPEWRAIRADGSPFPGEEHPAMRALQTGKPVMEELMGVFNPEMNKVVWIQVSAVPEFDASQRVSRVLATFSDITTEHEHLQELQKQEQLLRDFAWRQSHLLRAPLARILSLCEKDNGIIDSQFQLEDFRQTIQNSAHEMDIVLRAIAAEFQAGYSKESGTR